VPPCTTQGQATPTRPGPPLTSPQPSRLAPAGYPMPRPISQSMVRSRLIGGPLSITRRWGTQPGPGYHP